MVNKAILIGNVGRDPEVRYMANGNMVVNFSVATTESYKKDGEWVNNTEWHNLVAFRKTAEYIGNHIAKGNMVYVEGKLQTRSWEDKEGVKRYTTEVLIDTIRKVSGDKVDRPKENKEDDVPF